MGSVIKMYGAGTGGTQNGLAAIDCPMAGGIIGCQWAVLADLDADVEYIQAQLSFRGTGAFATNDDRGIISEVGLENSLLTSGIYPNSINIYLNLPDIPVMGGERLFLNVGASAGVVSQVVCLIHFTFDPNKFSSRRS